MYCFLDSSICLHCIIVLWQVLLQLVDTNKCLSLLVSGTRDIIPLLRQLSMLMKCDVAVYRDLLTTADTLFYPIYDRTDAV